MDRTLSTEEAVTAADATTTQTTGYLRKGDLTLELDQGREHGLARRFTLRDVYHLALLRQCTGLGLPASTANGLWRSTRHYGSQHAIAEPVFVITPGDRPGRRNVALLDPDYGVDSFPAVAAYIDTRAVFEGVRERVAALGSPEERRRAYLRTTPLNILTRGADAAGLDEIRQARGLPASWPQVRKPKPAPAVRGEFNREGALAGVREEAQARGAVWLRDVLRAAAVDQLSELTDDDIRAIVRGLS